MTNTEELEFNICGDCVVFIANDDTSGVADLAEFQAGWHRLWAHVAWGCRFVVTAASDDVNGFGSLEGDPCGGCGRVELLRGRALALPI